MKNSKKHMKQSNPEARQNFKFEHIHEGVVCLCCGRVMISYYRHDYQTCGCSQSSMVDGGQEDYVRYGGMNIDLLRRVEIVPILLDKNGKRSKKKLKTYREVQNAKRKR